MVSKYEQLVPVLFGEGAIKQLGEQVKALSCKKVLLISDAGVKAAGIGAKAEDSLKAAGMAYEIFDTVPPEPPSNLVDEISAKAKASGVDGVIGVGGGSSLDMAKAVMPLLAAFVFLYMPLLPIRRILTASFALWNRQPKGHAGTAGQQAVSVPAGEAAPAFDPAENGPRA